MEKVKRLSLSEKYELYEGSVQNPQSDVDYINEEFKRHFNRKPLTFREDFCGTGYLSCTWVQQSSKHLAYGIDLDIEPIKHGKETHYKKLNETEKKRIQYINGNVLDKFDFKVDVIAALNFSYFIFKERKELIKYFTRVHRGLKSTGAFVLDLFGGTECYDSNEDETDHGSFSYYWHCEKFNPINNHCLYHIHFKRNGYKYKNVFTYDWRMWSAQEIRECLEEAGFKKSFLYWEGFDKKGEGNGIFKITEEEENSAGWVAFIMALKT